MTREEIIAAAEAALILAGSSPRKETPTSLGIKHLADMLDRMRDPAFSMGKLNRWLGWMQAAVVAMGAGTLDQMKEINRPKDKEMIQGSVGREFGLPQSPAANTLIARLLKRAENGRVFHADRKLFAEAAEALASAEAAGTIAAARLAAEEMREPIIPEGYVLVPKVMTAEMSDAFWQSFYWAGPFDLRLRIKLEDGAAYRAMLAAAPPLPPSSSPEDQEKAKAAATPTIADPDGEARL